MVMKRMNLPKFTLSALALLTLSVTANVGETETETAAAIDDIA